MEQQTADGAEPRTGASRWEYPHFQLGGNPLTRNVNPVPRPADGRRQAEGESTDEWALPATWMCGEDVDRLDSGIVHWVIPRSDLAALRFDRVRASVEV
ncbi:DUF1963 domain-containing protein [Streptomyces sp. OZ13]|uniref:DUF1963 domain-containing protein n=1 Tax=Streptomyces sp. OZ13 TaxID=3452210 RepID=UPI003F8BCBCE